MGTTAKVALFIGMCLAIVGGVVGLMPVSADAGIGDVVIVCGSALGGGVADPPPICSEPLSAAGAISLGLLGVGLALGAAAIIFGRR